MIDPVDISNAANFEEVIDAARFIQSCLDRQNESLGQIAYPPADEWKAMSHAQRVLAIKGWLLAGACWKEP